MNAEDEKPKPRIEEAIAELEGILSSVESDATSLEESLSRYERGVALLKQCYETLAKAELRIQKVTGSEDGSLRMEDFAHSASVESKQDAAPTPEADERKPAKATRRKAVVIDDDIPF